MNIIHDYYYETENKVEKYTIERILNIKMDDFKMWLWEVNYILDNCKVIKELFSNIELTEIYLNSKNLKLSDMFMFFISDI